MDISQLRRSRLPIAVYTGPDGRIYSEFHPCGGVWEFANVPAITVESGEAITVHIVDRKLYAQRPRHGYWP